MSDAQPVNLSLGPEIASTFGAEAQVHAAAMHVPPDWAAAGERIAREPVRRVLVVGAVDAGKSTLCDFLLEAAARAGRSTALLDADLGQKKVGPPACVTLAEAGGVRLSFVGTTDPVRGWGRLLEGIRRLLGTAGADLVVTNTSGLLAGPGRRLKAAKIEAIRPDLIIALGSDPSLGAILGDHPDVPGLCLAPSPEARRKSAGQRRAARREAFGRYFAGASIRVLEQEALRPRLPDDLRQPGLLVGLADAAG